MINETIATNAIKWVIQLRKEANKIIESSPDNRALWCWRLGISEKTFYNKLKSNNWKLEELLIIYQNEPKTSKNVRK